jgi:hypothetical protein
VKLLLTTLPTNDLGLMTRSLPIARELAARGHEVAFSNPARAPSRLIAEAHFANILPNHPLHDLIAIDRTIGGLFRILPTRPWRRHGMGLSPIFGALPQRFRRAFRRRNRPLVARKIASAHRITPAVHGYFVRINFPVAVTCNR